MHAQGLNPNDLVRVELETALTRNIPVIPVFVAKAVMPTEAELPGNLKALAWRHGAEVRPGADFDAHAQRLIARLERHFAERSML